MGPGGSGLKPNTTGSSHRGHPASDFSTFSLVSNIPSMGVKVQSDAHYTPVELAGGVSSFEAYHLGYNICMGECFFF